MSPALIRPADTQDEAGTGRASDQRTALMLLPGFQVLLLAAVIAYSAWHKCLAPATAAAITELPHLCWSASLANAATQHLGTHMPARLGQHRFMLQLALCMRRNLADMLCGGQLPLDESVWFAMPALTTVRLSNNSCTGYVPPPMFTYLNYTTVDLRDNQFTGEVPYRDASTGEQNVMPSQAPMAGTTHWRRLLMPSPPLQSCACWLELRVCATTLSGALPQHVELVRCMARAPPAMLAWPAVYSPCGD